MESEQRNNLIMVVTSIVLGIYFLVFAPYAAQAALSKPIERLITVFQPAQPNGVWDSPVKILTITYYIWMSLYVYAGATLIVLSKFIYEGKKWSYPFALTLFAIPSIGGLTMVIPWIVLVNNDPVVGKAEELVPNHTGGMSPAMPIMLLGLLGYFIILFLMPSQKKERDWSDYVAKLVVFTLLGVVGGFTWMNSQHGVRFFLGANDRYLSPSASNPELFLGGYLMYTTVLFFLVTIFLLGYKMELGIWVGTTTTLITFTVNMMLFIDRSQQGMPSASDWLKGAILSLVLLVVLLLPWFKDRVLEIENTTK